MSKGLQEILGGRNMTGVIKTVQTGLPKIFPPSFYTPTKKVIGNTATYFKAQGARENAQTAQYGAPSRMVAGKGLAETGVTLAHVFEKYNHNPILLQNLMGTNGEPAQEIAIQELDRQSVEFKARCENTRTSAISSALALGKIYLDGNGNILYSSSGAVNTIDYGLPSTSIVNNGGTLIPASWATAGTKIIGSIVAIKAQQVQLGKLPLVHAFYGKNIAGYIAANTEASALINNTPTLAQERYAMAEIPMGFGGLQWHPGYNAYGLDSSGAVQTWLGADEVLFTPEPSIQWWNFIEGSYPVPRSVGNVYTDAVAAANDIDIVYGQFGYGMLSNDPVTVNQYSGDTFLPVLADPGSVIIATVV